MRRAERGGQCEFSWLWRLRDNGSHDRTRTILEIENVHGCNFFGVDCYLNRFERYRTTKRGQVIRYQHIFARMQRCRKMPARVRYNATHLAVRFGGENCKGSDCRHLY